MWPKSFSYDITSGLGMITSAMFGKLADKLACEQIMFGKKQLMGM